MSEYEISRVVITAMIAPPLNSMMTVYIAYFVGSSLFSPGGFVCGEQTPDWLEGQCINYHHIQQS
mgnify:CR=1 FL=1